MSKRYLQWGYDSFKDNKTGEICDNYIDLLNQQSEQIAKLEEQLKNARKETAKKVIDRVEELSVFDFKACEALYTITEPELDCILREFQGENK